MSTLKASISGIRGIIGDGLDVLEIVKYVSAFAYSLPVGSKVLIARDTRLTGDMVRGAVYSALTGSGIDVIDIGIVPTPTALFMVDHLNIDGGIMISASHNPIEWNALKLIGKNGRFLNQQSVDLLLQNYKENKQRFVPALQVGKFETMDNAIDLHVQKIMQFVNVDKIKNAKFKVACDYVNGTGLFATPKLFKALGVEEISINNEHTGNFAHVAEPSVDSMKDLSALVKKVNAYIGFTQDPDADRLAFVLNDGSIVSEEYTLALCAKYLWSVGKGNAAVNLSTSRMIDDIAKEFGFVVDRTKIGEINVSDHIREADLYFGGEGNGGIIVPKITPGRDSLLGMALILNLMAETGKSISELVNDIPSYVIVKSKYEVESIDQEKAIAKMKEMFPDAKITDIDGVKADFADAWVHIRASNTEPIVRIIAEAKTEQIANDYIEKVKVIL